MSRLITTWRKREAPLDWDHYVSEDWREAEQVVSNLKAQGIVQFHTYPLGDLIAELSSEF